jgi:hypothetical protein
MSHATLGLSTCTEHAHAAAQITQARWLAQLGHHGSLHGPVPNSHSFRAPNTAKRPCEPCVTHFRSNSCDRDIICCENVCALSNHQATCNFQMRSQIRHKHELHVHMRCLYAAKDDKPNRPAISACEAQCLTKTSTQPEICLFGCLQRKARGNPPLYLNRPLQTSARPSAQVQKDGWVSISVETHKVPGSSGEFRGVPGSSGEFRGSSGEFRGRPFLALVSPLFTVCGPFFTVFLSFVLSKTLIFVHCCSLVLFVSLTPNCAEMLTQPLFSSNRHVSAQFQEFQ